MNLIGQFGVGFYSGFLVANKMEVTTKGSEGKVHRWTATADKLDQYTINDVSDDSLDSQPLLGSTGTRITLHLRDEADQVSFHCN